MAWLLLSATADALQPDYERAFERELRAIVAMAPPYVWGGVYDDKRGIDCSGYLWLAAKRAGIPVRRTTAYRMAIGLDGWDGLDIERGRLLSDVEELDLLWWTWRDKPNRVHGHVGVILRGDKSGLLEVSHASTRRGVVLEPIRGRLVEDISAVRRLTIGDKKSGKKARR